MKRTLVADLQIGDKTPWYEIMGTPYEREDDNGTIVIIVPVRYQDGGEDTRMFSPDTKLEIRE